MKKPFLLPALLIAVGFSACVPPTFQPFTVVNIKRFDAAVAFGDSAPVHLQVNGKVCLLLLVDASDISATLVKIRAFLDNENNYADIIEEIDAWAQDTVTGDEIKFNLFDRNFAYWNYVEGDVKEKYAVAVIASGVGQSGQILSTGVSNVMIGKNVINGSKSPIVLDAALDFITFKAPFTVPFTL
jgi:hypothetical protein